MTECFADPATNAPNERHVKLYQTWGESGAGLLITGNIMVDRRYLEAPGNVVVEDEKYLSVLTEWSSKCQSHGSKLVAQISHPGRQCPISVSTEPLCPSASPPVQAALPLFRASRELTVQEIQDIIRRFAVTASVIQKAGFSGVQIHGAHGYLISQFLSPLINHRTDEYGGSASKRRQFLAEVVSAVRNAVGPKFIVSVKLNSSDFQKGGFTNKESFDVVRMLSDLHVDLIEVSGGTYENPKLLSSVKESTKQREAFFMEYVHEFRKVSASYKESKIPPLMLTGGFRTAAGMDFALASGEIDIVGIARPFATEPELIPYFLLPDSIAKNLSFVSPQLSIHPFLSKLDAAIENLWHQGQMELISLGQKPNFNLGYFRLLTTLTLFTYVWSPRRSPIPSTYKFLFTFICGVIINALVRRFF